MLHIVDLRSKYFMGDTDEQWKHVVVRHVPHVHCLYNAYILLIDRPIS